MSSEMRLQFYDADLKAKLQYLAADAEISLNQLVNKILAARFDVKQHLELKMLLELVEVKRAAEIS